MFCNVQPTDEEADCIITDALSALDKVEDALRAVPLSRPCLEAALVSAARDCRRCDSESMMNCRLRGRTIYRQSLGDSMDGRQRIVVEYGRSIVYVVSMVATYGDGLWLH